MNLDSFIDSWSQSGASERANYVSFLKDLCTVLDLPQPDPTVPDIAENAYVFERDVFFQNGDGTTSDGRIDLYKRGCFVLEAKQGVEAQMKEKGESLAAAKPAKATRTKKGHGVRNSTTWDKVMVAARNQAEGYVKALPPEEGNPPFVMVVDVGYVIEIFADFSRSGKAYVPFPDPLNHRIFLKDLTKPEARETLRAIWLDPMSLDPARRSAKVTREVAERLARLARSLERSGHAPETAAAFLMRAIFTFFAEDVKLIPDRSFTTMLEKLKAENNVAFLPDMLESLWSTMNTGGSFIEFRTKLLRFNGNLFAEATALPLDAEQLELLIEAGRTDWSDVEPSIFGTLLERALDPVERHKLGAHYTPRAYVERLVAPTIVEPLRAEWDAVVAAATTLNEQGKTKEAIAEASAFHRRLCTVRVLDPACGTGNFLYVALEHLKRIEGETLDLLRGLGAPSDMLDFTELTVDPHQLLGIEINPRAAAIADLVLWIGYLQWHFRTHGDALPREPVLRSYHNIECRDALLAYDAVEPLLDDDGKPVTRWDGRTTKTHPVTGEEVPDETARVTEMRYVNARKAEWPEAEFIVGNPPFIGTAAMRGALGDGYTKTVRKVYKELPESIDYVMYWWWRAGELARRKEIDRFGFITTNSIRQAFNRRVISAEMEGDPPLSLVYAIPDHPWVDDANGAAVRIAMTVGSGVKRSGLLSRVLNEESNEDGTHQFDILEEFGIITSGLTVGPELSNALPLQSNARLSSRGVQVIGSGFLISPDDAKRLGLGVIQGLENHIRLYRNGRDLTSTPRDVMAIDLYGLTETEVRESYPAVYQWILERVKPERDQNNRAAYREKWWVFGEPRGSFRPALAGLARYIVTVETSKYRTFTFLDKSILPDNRLVVFALDDPYYLGVLSSIIHTTWSLAAGGTLEDRPVYNKSLCFDAFFIPAASSDQQARIRSIAESLDTHRKRQQAQHPTLTITDMYNVLTKLRAGAPLTAKEKLVHEQGLVSVLRQLHDDLDRAVLEAYGWSDLIPLLDDQARAEELEQALLERLVALNAERAAEEKQGLVRWLRPEYQNPGGGGQEGMALPASTAKVASTEKVEKEVWPEGLKERLMVVRGKVAGAGGAVSVSEIASLFKGAKKGEVEEIVESLEGLGQVRGVGKGEFVA